MEHSYNKVIDILFLAKQEGVGLFLNGERLQFKIAEDKVISEGLLQQIRDNKESIIQYLASDNWKVKSVEEAQNAIIPFDRNLVQNIPLSFSQERLWFTDQLQGSVQYHSPSIMRLRGELDTTALAKSLETIIERHDILRTVFQEVDGRVYQKIKDPQGWQLQFIDGANYVNDANGLAAYIELLVKAPFDLSNDYPVRGTLIRLSEQEYVLVVTIHHIVSDAWSMSIIVKELVELYNCCAENIAIKLLPLPIQFADYAMWQRNYLQGEVMERKIAYWKKKLDEIVPLQLPVDFDRPSVKGAQGAAYSKKIGHSISSEINELARQNHTSLFMVLLSAFKVLLYRYSGQRDISVGTSIASRQQKELEGLIGFFVNTLTLRDEVDPRVSFLELLDQVRTTTLEAYENQEVPFEKVVETVINERDLSRSPLFQVMLVLQNTPESSKLKLGNVELSREPFAANISKFDFTFFINEGADGFNLLIQYSTDLFHSATIERMATHFEVLLQSIIENPAQQIGLLSILQKEESLQLLELFNDGKIDCPANKSIVDLFEEQVIKTPNNLALAFEDEGLTYQQLNEQANQLANALKSNGVHEGDLVPLFIDRSNAMMAGMLGILKAGAAYVPIDIDFPLERIAYMLKDTKARLIVSNVNSKEKLPAENGVAVVNIEETGNYSNDNLAVKPPPASLAYVIYTSGSTGQPKGVMIEHRNLIDYYYGLNNSIHVDQCHSFALVSTIATDLGNTVIFASLLSGGLLHLFSKESVSNIEYLHRYFDEHRIDCLKIVPSHWKALSADNLLLPKKLLVFGGEALQKELVDDILSVGSSCQVINHYGPTETTIGKLLHKVDSQRKYDKTIPVGRPFSNSKIYVLTTEMQLCPVGVPGQLYISGDGVSTGYFNKPSLTSEKFQENPFNGQPGTKLYSTGDLVKYLPDGNVMFIGRVDNQVKIRGYRIEPGEVESAMQQCALVSQAIVMAKDDKRGNTILVGYVVAEGGYNKEGIIQYLKDKLPEFMIPSQLIELEYLPLTANGKVDRKALPDPDGNDVDGNAYVAARNETEAKLGAIWEDILEEEPIGMNDDFFELGGHSLLAVRLVSAIRKAFSVEMPIGDIFDYPTVALLATRLTNDKSVDLLPVIEKRSISTDLIPLSFSQERLWFIDQLGGSLQYHVAAVLKLSGNLNREALAYALQKTVERHEVLRTVYKEVEGVPYQFFREASSWTLDASDGQMFINDDAALLKHVKTLINSPFLLSEDFMLRASLIGLQKNEHVLVVTIHHIASDGWSRSILVNDFTAFYRAFEEHLDAGLPVLPVHYADYAIWQRQYLEGPVLEKKIGYWKEKLTGVPALHLPLDFHRPAIQSTNGAIIRFNIEKSVSNELQQFSQNNGSTLFMTLISAFNVLLHRYSGQTDICIGTPTAGRHQQEVEGLIGFFVNTLAIRTALNSGESFTELLQQVRTGMLEAYQHQEAPFEKVVEAVVKERDMSRSPIFQVMFVLRNTPEVPELVMKEVHLSRAASSHNTSLFDLTLYITETENGLQGSVEYCTDLFSSDTIQQIIGHYKQLLGSAIENPNEKIGLLPMLSAKEKHQLLVEFNDTAVEYAHDKKISGLFESQASSSPAAVAVVFEERQLSYKQLNEQANQLAHYIHSKGIEPGALVPVCIERSLEMIIAVLGILKAGCTYVPIDPAYPEERINYMLADTAASIVICSKHTSVKIPALSEHGIIELDGKDLMNLMILPPTNLKIDLPIDPLAYILYTSGTTGKPKGVRMSCKALLNLLYWQDQQFVNRNRNVLQFASLNFDVSFQEIFSTLCFGSKLFLISSERRRDMTELFGDIVKYKITHIFIPFIVLKNLVEILPDDYPGLSLQEIIVAGEQLKLTEDIQEFIRKNNLQLVNQYGPTEAHVVSSYLINNAGFATTLPPIGKPIANTQLYILDEQGQPVPIGVAGELFIGGVQVAKGYHLLPDLTKEKFLDNFFSTDPETKLYKTGDLASWKKDGNINYLGRKDDQVKIRGYRVELGEIESVLQECPLVKQVAVIAKDDSSSGKRLVAYIVPEGDFSKVEILNYLKATLPEFMVPAVMVEMDQLPVTRNGKIDRLNLPDSGMDESNLVVYVAPRNETEQAIAEIWRSLLKLKQVGIYDNFFDLGGHSLLAIRLVHQVNKKLNLGLSINNVFINPTIAGLTEFTALQMQKSSDQAVEIKYLVPIKKGGSKKIPLYIICGGGGSAIRFRRFAEMLDEDQPVYSLQSPIDSKNLAEFPTTIEAIAACFITEIEVKNPNGPYALAGHCLGGIIAFEMARQIEAKGKKVSFLGMFDTIIRRRENGRPSNFKSFYNIPARTKKVVSKTLVKMDFQSFLWRKYTLKAMNYKLNSFNKFMLKTRKKMNHVDELEYVGLEIFGDSAEAYKAAAVKYKMVPYSGEILLFFAKERYFFTDVVNNIRFKKVILKDSIKNLWRNYASSTSMFEVEGDHSNMFEKSRGNGFARLVQELLNRNQIKQVNTKSSASAIMAEKD